MTLRDKITVRCQEGWELEEAQRRALNGWVLVYKAQFWDASIDFHVYHLTFEMWADD